MIRVYARSWPPTQPDWIISSSTIRQFSNFTTFDNPCRNIPAVNWLKFLFKPFVVSFCDVISRFFCQRGFFVLIFNIFCESTLWIKQNSRLEVEYNRMKQLKQHK